MIKKIFINQVSKQSAELLQILNRSEHIICDEIHINILHIRIL